MNCARPRLFPARSSCAFMKWPGWLRRNAVRPNFLAVAGDAADSVKRRWTVPSLVAFSRAAQSAVPPRCCASSAAAAITGLAVSTSLRAGHLRRLRRQRGGDSNRRQVRERRNHPHASSRLVPTTPCAAEQSIVCALTYKCAVIQARFHARGGRARCAHSVHRVLVERMGGEVQFLPAEHALLYRCGGEFSSPIRCRGFSS